MKLAWCGLLLIVGCHKHAGDTAAGGSAGSAEASGSIASGSAASGSAIGSAIAGSANTGSGTAVAGPQVAALDELDRWIAPIYKLDVPARYKAICAAAPTVREKVKALEALGPPSGVDAQTWTDTVEDLQGAVDGVRMCCQDLADYDKASAAIKKAADSNHDDCMKPVPDGFAAVVKLVPGAKPPGTHANDPVMTPPK